MLQLRLWIQNWAFLVVFVALWTAYEEAVLSSDLANDWVYKVLIIGAVELPGLKYRSLATPTFRVASVESEGESAESVGWFWLCKRRFARLASASMPSGFSSLSGKECNLGEPGCCKEARLADLRGGGGDGVIRVAWVLSPVSGEGDRDSISEAMEVMLGFPMERRTVSSVFSILRSERVNCSCFLALLLLTGLVCC